MDYKQFKILVSEVQNKQITVDFLKTKFTIPHFICSNILLYIVC